MCGDAGGRRNTKASDMSIQPISNEEQAQNAQAPARQPVTYRAIALGACCAGFLAWGGHYTRHIAHSTKMAQDHLPWGVVVPLFVIVVVLNKLIEKVRPRAVLTPTTPIV